VRRISFGLTRLTIARVLIGAVLVMNVQSALAFFLNPARYAPAYELVGVPGEAAIRGYGVLFLMWNVPYWVALLHPQQHRTSLYEAVAMQTIGLIGESFILWGLPEEHATLQISLTRFILFDGGGLAALLWATLLTRKKTSTHPGFLP